VFRKFRKFIEETILAYIQHNITQKVFFIMASSSGNTKQAVLVVAVIFGVAVGTIWYVSFIGASVPSSNSSNNKGNFIITANGERRHTDIDHEVQRQQRTNEDTVKYTEGLSENI